MFDKLSTRPGTYAVALALDLALRSEALDAGPELEQIRSAIGLAVGTTVYATRAKALLVRPLIEQKVQFAEQLAIAAGGHGIFDWGGSDGISCILARHHGAKDVHLHEPNPAARAFGKWLANALGFDDIGFHEHDPALPPAGRRFGAGICTEVLEHVVDPPRMIKQMFNLLIPGGILFVTSSFGVTQDTHLRQNVKFSGREAELMIEAGFESCTPTASLPVPFLPQWGFWRRPG